MPPGSLSYTANFVTMRVNAPFCETRNSPMISPKASQRLDNYHCACSSKNGSE
jgi:hypothetical protein